MRLTNDLHQSRSISKHSASNLQQAKRKTHFNMSRNMMVLFLLVAVVCATAMSNPSLPKKPLPTKPLPPLKCGKNEVFKKCGPAIQSSCKDPKPIRNKKCVSGCFCKDGLVRNSKGECIRSCECDC